MKKATLAEMRSDFDTYINVALKDEAIVITRNRKAVAVMLSVKDDDEAESYVLGHSPGLVARDALSRPYEKVDPVRA